jgi:hypothetical protein
MEEPGSGTLFFITFETRFGGLKPNRWTLVFGKVNRDGVVTRQAADPLNVKIPAARLDLRKKLLQCQSV